jgi:glutaredoxin 3
MDVRIYTTTHCGYCYAAKSILAKRGVAFAEVDCTRDAATRQWLIEQTGQRTVPQIFIGDVAIGGYRELSGLDRDGRLQAILDGQAPPPPVL